MSSGHAPRLRCTACAREHAWSLTFACASCGGFLEVEYDLEHARIGKEGPTMERYRDLLPLQSAESIFDSGEGHTRCLHARELGRAIGLDAVWLKVESDNPTRTVKDRQGSIAIAALRELGVRNFVTASTGNSCTSMARVMARFPDMHMHAFVGDEFLSRVDCGDSPNVSLYWLPDEPFVAACDAAAWYAGEAGLAREGGFFFFGKREGLKTAYLEAATQVDGDIEVYVQGVSSAIGVYATHRAAGELRALGYTRSMPRLVCVQEQSCDPMVRSFVRGAAAIHPDDIVPRPHGLAKATLRGDPSRTYPLIRDVVLASGGTMLSADAEAIERARSLAQETEGLDICAASALTIAAASDLLRRGFLRRETVVLLNLTGADRPPSARPADFVVERDNGGWMVTAAKHTAASVLATVIEEVRRSQQLADDMPLDADTALLKTGLALDSVGLLELLLSLEKRFCRRIEEHEVTEPNFATIGALARFVAGKLGERPDA